MGSHYYSQHAVALKSRAGRSPVHGEIMRPASPQVRAGGTASWPCRQFAILAAGDLGAHPFRESPDLDPAGARPGLHGLQLHHPAARGRAPTVFERRRPRAERVLGLAVRDSERHLAEPVHTLAPRSPRGAGIGRKKTRSGITCRRRSTSAGTSCSTARRRCSRSISAPRGASRPPTTALQARIAGSARSRSPSTSARSRWSGTCSASTRRCATNIIPVFFIFPIAFTLNRLGQHYDIDPSIRRSGAR